MRGNWVILFLIMTVPLLVSASPSGLEYGMAKNPSPDMVKVQYVEDDVWIVKADASRIEKIQPEKKTSQALLNGAVNEWAKQGDLAIVHALFYPGISQEEIELEVQGTFIQDIVKVSIGTIVTLKIHPEDIALLASNNKVSFIQETSPPPKPDNDESRAYAGVDILHTPTYDLSGKGVIAAQWDAGCAGHIDYNSRMTCADGSSTNWHSIHVAGTMLGDGNNSQNKSGTAYQWRGMAPNATLISYDWWYIDGVNLSEFDAEYNESINYYNATISQNSWNVCPTWNATTCDAFLGEYFLEASMFDDVVRGSEGKYMVMVWSAGNDRGTGSCGSCGSCCGSYGYTYDTIGAYASAKNLITVGAMDKDFTISSYTSWGPTNDGRLKPDIMAIGTDITSTYTNNNYATTDGTSMAAPAVSGIVALLTEKLRDKYPKYNVSDELLILPSTFKAILLHTAKDYGNTGPDYQFGYGLINASKAIDLIENDSANNIRFFEAQLDNSTYQFNLTNYTYEDLKVTLAWDDYPGTPYANKTLVHDLDLYVLESDGTMYYPWLLDPDSPSVAATTGVDDTNNVEQVVLSNMSSGNWSIFVNGTSLAYGPQNFSIVFTYFDATSPVISLHNPIDTYNSSNTTMEFNCSATDGSDIANITLFGNWSGWHANGTNTTGEGVFTRTIPHGDYTWSCYACDNADNCAFASNRTFSIDTFGPSLSYPINSSLTNESVVINWTTNELANTSIQYGLNTTNLSNIQGNASLTTAHPELLSGLTNGTTYYYNISSCDQFANCNSTGIFNFTTLTPDGTPPTISIISPNATNTTSSSIEFLCNVSDLNNITSVSLYGNWSGWHSNQTNTSTDNGAVYNFSIAVPDGSLEWTCYACDGTSNCAFGYNATIIKDSAAPNITTYLNNTQTNITLWDFNLSLVDEIYTTGNNCTLVFDNVSNITIFGMNNSLEYNATLNLSEANHSWYFNCSDPLGNSAVSPTKSLLITSTPRNVTNISLTNQTNGAVLINWTAVNTTVTNNSVVLEVTYLIFKHINESSLNSTYINNISNQFVNTTNSSYSDIDVNETSTYYYVITVIDGIGQYNNSFTVVNISTENDCSNDFSAWSACSAGSKTRIRTCYYESDDDQTLTSTDGCTSNTPSPSPNSDPAPSTTTPEFEEQETIYTGTLYKFTYWGENETIDINETNESVTLEENEELYVAYLINFTSNDTNITNATLSFKVPKAWYTDNVLDPNTTTFEIDDESLSVKRTEDDDFYYFDVFFSNEGLLTMTAELNTQLTAGSAFPDVQPEVTVQNTTINGTEEHETGKTQGFKWWIIPLLVIVFGAAAFYLWKTNKLAQFFKKGNKTKKRKKK